MRRIEGELLREFARLKWLHAREWIDRFAQDFLRRLRRDGFDLHAALRARHHQRCGYRAIEQNGEINFARDLGRFRDEDFVDDAAVRAGLMRDQSLPEHFRGNFARFLGRLHEVHAAFESIRERPLPSPAGMNLRFHHEIDISQLARDLLSFFRCGGHFSTRRGHAEFLQQSLRLILVNVHSGVREQSLEMRARQSKFRVT